MLDELGARGEVDWSSAMVDAASVRAKKGVSLTGPNPVDRGKKGGKLTASADALAPQSLGKTEDVLQHVVAGAPNVEHDRVHQPSSPVSRRSDCTASVTAWVRTARSCLELHTNVPSSSGASKLTDISGNQ
ncbi:hypothetical protein ACIBBB_23220 [Streptomyces sp. NPDC051217]|uniref:hypothetical protein n=1 Tax=Streptomyces sp. NPDC051217 TaxID=3365644 RepID=UPI0037984314